MSHTASSRTGKTLYWLITALIWAALFTPLIISAETFFPFQAGKGFAFRALVEVAGFLYLWLAIIDRGVRPRPRKLFWSVLVFGGTLLATMFTGINPYRSFWGDLERMEGVFGILHGVLLFVIAYGLFSRREDWTRFFVVSLFASFFVSFYAFAQVDPSFRFFPVVEPKDVQPGSTLGHQSFVATYAIFQVFFGLFVAVMQTSARWRVFGVSLSVLNGILLMLTAVRGAQIGMLAALAVGIILAILFVVKNLRSRIILGGALITSFVLFGGVIALKNSPLIEKLPYGFQRVATISLDTPTARTRLISLQVSWEAFKERPILGWGQENFKPAYTKYFNPEHLTHEQEWFDRAHNKLAEVAVQSGIIGLLGYLSIFVTAFLGMIRYLKTRDDVRERMLAIGVIMLGSAYFVQNLFLFDTPMSYVLFFSSLAFVGFLVGKAEELGREVHRLAQLQSDFFWRRRRPILVIAGALTIFLLVRCNWIPYTTATTGRLVQEIQEPRQALAQYNRAVESGGFPVAEVNRATMELLVTDGRVKTKEWGVLFARVRQEVETVFSEEYADVPTLVRLGKLYNERGSIEPQYLYSSERVLRKAIVLSPTRPEGYYELGVMHLQRGEGESGLQLFREALALNKRNARAHWVLGLALASQKHSVEGLTEMEAALAMGYNWDNPADINNVAIVYTSMNLNERLARFFENVVDCHPENAGYRVTLAKAYASIGEKKRAKEQVLTAVQLDRRFEQNAAHFIQNLGL